MTAPRTPSQSIIVRRAPSFATSLPPGIASSPTPISSAATTKLIRVAEPDVSSTNQGSASHVICDPVTETISAASRAASERLRSIRACGGRGRPRTAVNRRGSRLLGLGGHAGGAHDRDVAAQGLEAELGHGPVGDLAVADVELGRD